MLDDIGHTTFCRSQRKQQAHGKETENIFASLHTTVIELQILKQRNFLMQYDL